MPKHRPIRNRYRTYRLLLVAAAVAGCAVLAGGAGATVGTWNCGTYSGTQVHYCTWGYNYVNSSTGEPQSPYNYYYEQDVYKSSGGTIQIGVGPLDGCFTNKTGSGTWYIIIQNVWGCGGYMYNYLTYDSGAQSYVQQVGSTAP